MAYPSPPQIDAAIDQLKQVIKAVDNKDVDVLNTPWPELEQSIKKLLQGPYNLQQTEHQVITIALAGVLGVRLSAEFGAFWFLNRETPEGASMGFPEAFIMLQPFGAAADALTSGSLMRLDALMGEIRRTLAQVRFSPQAQAQGTPKLTPEDYTHRFDPGVLQLLVVDPAKAKPVWEGTPATVSRELREGLARANQLPKEVKQQMEAQLVGSLQRLEPAKGVLEQAPQVAELLTHLFGTVENTGFAPEEVWSQVALPLLFIGAPAQFPPLDEEEVEAFKEGADPLALFVELVPYQTPAVEEGLLGAIPLTDIDVVHPGFARAGANRLLRVKLDTLGPLFARFDVAKSKETLARFVAYLEEKAGQKPKATGQPGMTEGAYALLTDFKHAVETARQPNNLLCLRRVTAAEAESEPALAVLRAALHGPRIILA